MRTSSRPWRSRTSATAARTPASSSTSSTTEPAPRSAAARSPVCASRAPRTTVSPAAASWRPTSRPMPRLPPVISATRPCWSMTGATLALRYCDAALPVARSTYDAVIVGGGHNGLVAAAYLARAGRSTLLLERRDELGGATVSEQAFPGVDARLSRYSYLVSLLPQVIVEELGLPLRLARRRISSYTPDPRAVGRHGLLVDALDPEATAASFRRVTGGDGDRLAWDELYGMTRRVAQAVFPTLTEPLRSRDELRGLVGDDAAWDAVFETPLGDTVGRAFGDDLVAGVVLTDALIGTFAAAGDADLRQNRCFLYHIIGGGTGDWDVPIGGMGAVSGALAQAARAAGAQLHTGAEVLALEPGAGGAGVRFSDGDTERVVRARHV